MDSTSAIIAAPDWIVIDRDGIAVGCIDHYDPHTASRIASTVFPEMDRSLDLVAWNIATDVQRRDAEHVPRLTLRTAMKLMDSEVADTRMERTPKRRPQAPEQVNVRRFVEKLPQSFRRTTTGGGR